jgi:hypothetical protein
MSTIAELAAFLAREDHVARTATTAAASAATQAESAAPPIKAA